MIDCNHNSAHDKMRTSQLAYHNNGSTYFINHQDKEDLAQVKGKLIEPQRAVSFNPPSYFSKVKRKWPTTTKAIIITLLAGKKSWHKSSSVKSPI